MIDGWVDAIADAVEDDEAAGPVFDPFAHKLVRKTMADYLEQIAQARAEVARLKGEKEAFEQSNPPEDADEEEMKDWNYAKDIERQIKELKAANREALKELSKLERAASRARATEGDRRAADKAKNALQPVLDELGQLESALGPYEEIRSDLSAARARFRDLTNAFVDELRKRCAALSEDDKRALVLELCAQDLQNSLDNALVGKRHMLTEFVERLWDKYRMTLLQLRINRLDLERAMSEMTEALGYV